MAIPIVVEVPTRLIRIAGLVIIVIGLIPPFFLLILIILLPFLKLTRLNLRIDF